MKGKKVLRLDPELLGDSASEFQQFLCSNVIDQRMAISRLTDAFALSLSPIRPTDKPIFAGIFLGPSGVGKTLIAEMTAQFLLGNPNSMTKIACAEYMESHQISRLLGSPPGYVGFDDVRGKERNPPILSQEKINSFANNAIFKRLCESDAVLKKMQKELESLSTQRKMIRRRMDNMKDGDPDKKIKKNLEDQLGEHYDRIMDNFLDRVNRIVGNFPRHSIILFDEVEKAHPRILDALLEITSKANATMSSGEPTSFIDSFVIMTSNIGSAEIADSLKGKHPVGFGTSTKSSVYQIAMEQLRKYFRPELIGRIKENIVVFNQLSHSSLRKIINLQIKRLATAVLSRGKVSVTVHPRVNRFIFEHACDHPEYGARLVEDKIQSYIAKPLAKLFGSDQIRLGDSLTVDIDAKANRPVFFKEMGKSSIICIPDQVFEEMFGTSATESEP